MLFLAFRKPSRMGLIPLSGWISSFTRSLLGMLQQILNNGDAIGA
jgi:hypothetical protein